MITFVSVVEYRFERMSKEKKTLHQNIFVFRKLKVQLTTFLCTKLNMFIQFTKQI
jgi:hypothetical protein